MLCLTAGICGNCKLVVPLAQDLSRKFPDDTLIQRVFIPLANAFVALSAGQPRQAMDDAEPAKSFALIYPGSYLQGLAYLQLHEANQAASAFRVTIPVSWRQSPGADALLRASATGLGAGLSMGGDKADAKKSYEAFFTTWKNADADLPMLMAAKKEYAAL